MLVHIHNLEDLAVEDMPALNAAMLRIKRFYGGSDPAQPIDVWCNSRRRDGMLEILMRLPYAGGQGHITIGAVQRSAGAEVEFHS